MREGLPELMVVHKQAAESCEFGQTGNVSMGLTSRRHHQFCLTGQQQTHVRPERVACTNGSCGTFQKAAVTDLAAQEL